MKTEKLIALITEMAELIQFHELETVDSKALDLLLKAQEAKTTTPVDDKELSEWMETVRVANICDLSP